MSKSTALNLTMLSSWALMVGAIIGLAALGANESTIALGALVPFLGGAYLTGWIVFHYGADQPKR